MGVCISVLKLGRLVCMLGCGAAPLKELEL
jgi:hypothetical protein